LPLGQKLWKRAAAVIYMQLLTVLNHWSSAGQELLRLCARSS